MIDSKIFFICYITWVLIFVLSFIGMYLVKDYRNGIIYKGFIGKIQNIIKH